MNTEQAKCLPVISANQLKLPGILHFVRSFTPSQSGVLWESDNIYFSINKKLGGR